MSAYSSFKRNNTSKQEHISSPGNQMSPPARQLPPSVPGSLGSDYQAHANHGGFQEAHCGGDDLHTEPRGVALSHRGSPVPWNDNFRPPPPRFNHLGPPQWVPRSFPFSQGNHDMGDNRFGGRGGSYNNTAPQFPQYGPRQASNWAGNTYPSSARGRSRGRNTSFGRGGGRRHMEQGADRFYSNSMAEDPWKYLKPVLWKSCSVTSSSNSTGQAWRPNSIAPKKPMIIEASHKPSNNQQSLAEYLAASLDEATSDDPSN
ncbi:unnamed protein product [Brassica oleracea]